MTNQLCQLQSCNQVSQQNFINQKVFCIFTRNITKLLMETLAFTNKDQKTIASILAQNPNYLIFLVNHLKKKTESHTSLDKDYV